MMSLATVRDLGMYFEVRGEGPRLLVIHGTGGLAALTGHFGPCGV